MLSLKPADARLEVLQRRRRLSTRRSDREIHTFTQIHTLQNGFGTPQQEQQRDQRAPDLGSSGFSGALTYQTVSYCLLGTHVEGRPKRTAPTPR